MSWALQNVHEAAVAGDGAPRPVARIAIARLTGGKETYRVQRAAVRELLVELAGRTLADGGGRFEVRGAPGGRPLLWLGGAPSPDVAVSLSHSRGWIAAGLARGARLGIDVEQENPRRRIAAMANWLGWADCRTAADFYRAWTYREACIKCRGGEGPPEEGARHPPAAGGAPGRHHAAYAAVAPGVHGCAVLETGRLVRLSWSVIPAADLFTWS